MSLGTPEGGPESASKGVRESEAGLAVLVPLKPFPEAKSRLGERFDQATRALIAESLARRVLETARDAFPGGAVYVVAASSLGPFVESMGARLIAESADAGTLGRVVDAALDELAAHHDRALVVMGDLPDVTVDALRELVAWSAEVVLAESENGDGTNALVLALPARFATAFAEPTSGHVHEARAREASLTFVRVRRAELVRDLDRPHDLREDEVARLQASASRSRTTSRGS